MTSLIERVGDIIKDDRLYCKNSDISEVGSKFQSFNKSMIELRIAMNRLRTIIEDEELTKKIIK